MQEYKLRKDVDELQIAVAQAESNVKVLQSITLNGNDYYTKDEVDEELQRLMVKSEGLPYFSISDDGDLMMDLSLSIEPYFSLSNGDLIVSSSDGELHFFIDDFGDLWFTTDVLEV